MKATCFRAIVLALLAAVLAFPPGDWFAGAQQQKPPEKKKDEPQDQFSLAVEVPIVSVDVVVTDNNGNFLSGLKKENFRILEDGVPQSVTNFSPTDAPITMVVVMEFSRIGYGIFSYYAKAMAYDFLHQLKPDDWIALVSFDMKTRIEADFTKNKNEVAQALQSMIFPGFSESNIFDALLETLDRLQEVKGKKSILLLGTGRDTFSRHTLDDTLKRLKQSDVTIFTVVAGKDFIEYLDARGAFGGSWGPAARMEYLQAENQMRAIAQLTGGRYWAPRFEGEWPGIFSDVAASLRNQYNLAYSPTNRTRDGKFRKIKVEIVGANGAPLIVQDPKGKKVKFVVYAREGYLAPKGPIGD
jgi:VWFA-related protein